MRIISQNKQGIITEAIKAYDELAEDELASLQFAFGVNAADHEYYQVRRNGKNGLVGVTPYDHGAASQAGHDDAGRRPSIMDAMQVVYGRGKAKTQAVKKYAEAGYPGSGDKEAVPPRRDETLIDGYLAEHDLTRYAVAKKTGVLQSTLSSAAARDTAKSLSAKVISAIAMTIETDPGAVLNDLICMEAERTAR